MVSLLIYSRVLAAPGDLGITFVPAVPGGGLFYEINMKPLDSSTKQVTVKNKSDQIRKFAVEIDQLVGYEPLASVLTLDISRGGVLILSKHLSDFLNNPVSIEDIPGDTTHVYNFKVTLDDVGNEYQAREIKSFNYVFGFEGEPGEEGVVAGEKTGLPETGPSIIIPLLLPLVGLVGLKIIKLKSRFVN